MKGIAVIIISAVLFTVSFSSAYADAESNASWQIAGGYVGGLLGALVGSYIGALPVSTRGLGAPSSDFDTFWSTELLLIGLYAGGILGSASSVYGIGKLAGGNGSFLSTLAAGGITSGISFLAMQLILLTGYIFPNSRNWLKPVEPVLLFAIIAPIIATPIFEARVYRKSEKSADKKVEVNLLTVSF